jgi:tetratricopeptide (TPR) repeat protein
MSLFSSSFIIIIYHLSSPSSSSFIIIIIIIGVFLDYINLLIYCVSCIRLNPRYIDAMMNLAGILNEQNKLDESETYYKKVLMLSPNNADGHNNYGVFLAKIGTT